MNLRRAELLVALGVAATMLAACTSSGNHAPTGKGPASVLRISGTPGVGASATPRVDSAQGLVLPIVAYFPSVAEQNVVGDAESTLVQRCMAGFGFDWPLHPSANVAPVDMLRGHYGIADAAEAAQYGYHPVQSAASGKAQAKRSAAANGQGSQTVSAAEQLVLSGSTDGGASAGSYGGKQIPKGGCGGQADRAIFPHGEPPEDVASNLLGAGLIQSQDDARVQSAMSRWAACMARSGYQVQRQGKVAPVYVAGSQFDLAGPVTQPEIQEATTDVGCKKSTNLIGIWFAVESAYENAGIQQNIQALTAEKNAWAAAAAKAAGIIGVPVPK